MSVGLNHFPIGTLLVGFVKPTIVRSKQKPLSTYNIPHTTEIPRCFHRSNSSSTGVFSYSKKRRSYRILDYSSALLCKLKQKLMFKRIASFSYCRTIHYVGDKISHLFAKLALSANIC